MEHQTKTAQKRVALIFLRENTSWDLSMMGSICNNYCKKVLHNTRPRDGISSHYLVGVPIMRLQDTSSKFTNVFCSPPPSGGFLPFSFFHIPECFWILFELPLCGSFTISHIVAFISTIISGDVFKVSLVFFYPLWFHLHHPQFSHAGQTQVGFWHLEIGIAY